LSASVRIESSRWSGTILGVDDVAANVQLLQKLLTRDGCTVVTASDGEEALELLKEVRRGWRRRDLGDAFIALGIDGIRLSTEPPGVSQ
jgi:CheY-like chemotaxis protein